MYMRCDPIRFDLAKVAFAIHQRGSTIEDTVLTVRQARWLTILYPCLVKPEPEDDGMPRCALCGIAEEDQDWDFDEYKDETGVSYLCLNCIETY